MYNARVMRVKTGKSVSQRGGDARKYQVNPRLEKIGHYRSQGLSRMLWRTWKKSDNALVSGPGPCAEDEVGRGGVRKQEWAMRRKWRSICFKTVFTLTLRTRFTLAPLTGQWKETNKRNLEEPSG